MNKASSQRLEQHAERDWNVVTVRLDAAAAEHLRPLELGAPHVVEASLHVEPAGKGDGAAEVDAEIIRRSRPDDLIGFYRAEARAAASRGMRELVSSRVSSNAVNPLIVHGDAVATLLDKERELNADLIVLTRRNKSLTEELLLESVTSKLLERSRCDVLVMH